jgi:hypothetical protein
MSLVLIVQNQHKRTMVTKCVTDNKQTRTKIITIYICVRTIHMTSHLNIGILYTNSDSLPHRNIIQSYVIL